MYNNIFISNNIISTITNYINSDKYYFILNNSNLIIENNTDYILTNPTNSEKFKVKINPYNTSLDKSTYDNIKPYYVIIVNNNIINFESINYYKINKYTESSTISECNSNNIFKIKTVNSQQQICCNIPYLGSELNRCNSDVNTNFCFLNGNKCKNNYITINYVDSNHNYYFYKSSINIFSENKIIYVDIIRNFKNQKKLKITLNYSDLSTINIIKQNLINLPHDYLIYNPLLLQNKQITDSTNIISNNLVLYNNNINILHNNKYNYNLFYYNNINNINSNHIILSKNENKDFILISFSKNINLSQITIYYTIDSNTNIIVSTINTNDVNEVFLMILLIVIKIIK